MKITKRERGLLTITITVILVVVNYFLIIPLLRSWQDTGNKLTSQQRQLELMKATIERAPQWRKQYDELKQSLGERAESFQTVNDVLTKVEQVATKSGVQVTSRSGRMAEEDKGVYRVLPAQFAVDANTDSLVRFLFALQTGAGFISVEQLQITPRPDNPGILRCDIQLRALAAKKGNSKS